MTVGQLREELSHVPSSAEVYVEAFGDEETGLAQVIFASTHIVKGLPFQGQNATWGELDEVPIHEVAAVYITQR